MFKEFIINILSKNQGRVIGAVIGFIIAVSILLIGFFSTLLIVLFTLVGYYIGKKIDNKEDIVEMLDRILPSGWK